MLVRTKKKRKDSKTDRENQSTEHRTRMEGQNKETEFNAQDKRMLETESKKSEIEYSCSDGRNRRR